MFFSITGQQDNRFPNHQMVGRRWFNSDNGWQTSNNSFYKGYQDNFCRIVVADEQIKVEHNTYRSFPLWHDQHTVTNLPGSGLTPAWADDQVILQSNGTIEISKTQLDLTVPDKQLDTDQALLLITELLDAKVQHLKHSISTPIKLFCSGGLDTMLLYAMLNYHQVPYDLILDSWYEQDQFTSQNATALDQLWAYRQIHHWSTPTWLATGSCGDEYFLRGPAVLALVTAWNNIDFESLLQDHTDCYHHHYFAKYSSLWKENWQSRDQLRTKYASVADLNRQILNILVNDHQHWHLGNTATWTPFNDIEITRILLQCRTQDLLPQFLDGQLTKRLISHYDPSALGLISHYKNQNPQQNLKKALQNQ
jgi:hypothetical protein